MVQEKAGASPVNVRNLALDLLIQVMEENIFCDRALHCAFERYPMEKRGTFGRRDCGTVH